MIHCHLPKEVQVFVPKALPPIPEGATDDEIVAIVSSCPTDYFRFSVGNGDVKILKVLRTRCGFTCENARETWWEKRKENESQYDHKSAIRQASVGNHVDVLRELREGYGLTTEDAGWNSNISICLAARLGNLEAVRELIEGYNLFDYKTATGLALMRASEGGQVEIIKYLHSRGFTKEKAKMYMSGVFFTAKNAETLRTVCELFNVTEDDCRSYFSISIKNVINQHAVEGRCDVLAFLRDELGINKKEDAEYGFSAVEKGKIAKGMKTKVQSELKKFKN